MGRGLEGRGLQGQGEGVYEGLARDDPGGGHQVLGGGVLLLGQEPQGRHLRHGDPPYKEDEHNLGLRGVLGTALGPNLPINLI